MRDLRPKMSVLVKISKNCVLSHANIKAVQN